MVLGHPILASTLQERPTTADSGRERYRRHGILRKNRNIQNLLNDFLTPIMESYRHWRSTERKIDCQKTEFQACRFTMSFFRELRSMSAGFLTQQYPGIAFGLLTQNHGTRHNAARRLFQTLLSGFLNKLHCDFHSFAGRHSGSVSVPHHQPTGDVTVGNEQQAFW